MCKVDGYCTTAQCASGHARLVKSTTEVIPSLSAVYYIIVRARSSLILFSSKKKKLVTPRRVTPREGIEPSTTRLILT